MNSRGTQLALALLRIYTGVFWLVHGVPKFLNSDAFMPPNGFMPQLVAKAASTNAGWYHDFLVNVVIPHIALFAELTRLGEVLVGFSLLFGLFTRFGGLVGTLLALNYLTANTALASYSALGTLDAAAAVLSFTHVVLPSGRTLGVDALFTRRARVRETRVTPEFVDEPASVPPAAGP